MHAFMVYLAFLQTMYKSREYFASIVVILSGFLEVDCYIISSGYCESENCITTNCMQNVGL
jgi:hypothetical protein